MMQKKEEVRALQEENIQLHQHLNKKDVELHQTLKRVHEAQEKNDELVLKVRTLQEQQLASLNSVQTEANQKLETQATEQYTLTYEMSVGIKFASEKLSEQYQLTVMEDTKQAYEQDFSVSVSIPCTAKPAADGVGLWQYVTKSADGKSETWTLHTVCRYGEYYNRSPECPWAAC